MEKFNNFGIYAEHLKSFGAKRQGFDSIKNINLIAGRNNSGKSSLVDLIYFATVGKMEFPENHWHGKNQTRIITHSIFSEDDSNKFPRNTSGGMINGNHHDYGVKFIRSRLFTYINGLNKGTLISCDSALSSPSLMDLVEYKARIENSPLRNLLQGYRFHRLGAERNIVPEEDSSEIGIDSTGVGATNLIQNFINKSNLPSDLIEKILLDALNVVFSPDAVFTDIVCQQHPDRKWEVFLEEKFKGRIALSQSGSGLKTIILVLCFIHLLPIVSKERLNKFVFAFEELENNLHPALQRRLLNYISQQSLLHDFPIFLTTHSSVAIDMFNKRNDSQIIHVTHDGTSAVVNRVTTYIESKGILDDLDLRASDLLQSNGIIWVEGPSDRIYINKWIEIVSDNTLLEGTHYQCIFYGGRLLSHLSAETEDFDSDGIPLLTINRNAAIIIDSDRRKEDDPLNKTKLRILEEFGRFNGFTWVTSGREIENYISDAVLEKWLPTEIRKRKVRNKYTSFFDSLNKMQSGLGDKYEGKKPLLAEQITRLVSLPEIKTDEDLFDSLVKLCLEIRRWNRMPHNVLGQGE